MPLDLSLETANALPGLLFSQTLRTGYGQQRNPGNLTCYTLVVRIWFAKIFHKTYGAAGPLPGSHSFLRHSLPESSVEGGYPPPLFLRKMNKRRDLTFKKVISPRKQGSCGCEFGSIETAGAAERMRT